MKNWHIDGLRIFQYKGKNGKRYYLTYHNGIYKFVHINCSFDTRFYLTTSNDKPCIDYKGEFTEKNGVIHIY